MEDVISAYEKVVGILKMYSRYLPSRHRRNITEVGRFIHTGACRF